MRGHIMSNYHVIVEHIKLRGKGKLHRYKEGNDNPHSAIYVGTQKIYDCERTEEDKMINKWNKEYEEKHKTIKDTWKRNCLCIPCDEFEEIVDDMYGDRIIEINYDMEDNGWTAEEINDDNGIVLRSINEKEIAKKLKEYLQLKEITSIHTDNYNPCCFWISYKE